MGFGRRALVFAETIPAAVVLGTAFTEIVREDVHVIKAGLNYRFNWGPGR
jgi:hypothetical protein